MITTSRCLLAVNGSVTYLDFERIPSLRSSDARKDPILAPAFTGGVYILHNPRTDLVKIGYSGRSMISRWRGVECASGVNLNPVMLWAVSGPREIEQSLHQRFAEHRERGEWFQSDPVMTWISDFAVTATWTSRPDSALPKPVLRAFSERRPKSEHAELVEEMANVLWRKLAREVGPRDAAAQQRWFSTGRRKRLKEVRAFGVATGLWEKDGNLYFALDPHTGERLQPDLPLQPDLHPRPTLPTPKGPTP